MRNYKLSLLLLLAPGSLLAAHKVVSPTATGGNDRIEVSATISLAEDEVTQKLGINPGKGIVLVEVRATPKGEKALSLSPDDFILLAHDDGQRVGPYEPAQLAGSGGLVIHSGPNGNSVSQRGTTMTTGMGGIGLPSRRPGKDKKDGEKNNEKDAAPRPATNDGGNALLLTKLKEKQFPAKDGTEPVEGFLYFPLDGKHKLKNMAVLYRGPAGKLDLEFEH